MTALRKKHSTLISSVLLAVFLSLLAVETSHHHGKMEDNDNCSMCAWQMTGSQGVAAPASPVLMPVLLVMTLFFFFPCLQFFKQIQSRGRSPPLLPL
jgi:hypothetical protein